MCRASYYGGYRSCRRDILGMILLRCAHGSEALFIERSQRTSRSPDRYKFSFGIIPYTFGLKVGKDSLLRSVNRVRYVVAGMGSCTR